MGLNAFFVYTVCIAFGLISYIVISVFCGDIKKIKGSSWVIAAFLLQFFAVNKEISHLCKHSDNPGNGEA